MLIYDQYRLVEPLRKPGESNYDLFEAYNKNDAKTKFIIKVLSGILREENRPSEETLTELFKAESNVLSSAMEEHLGFPQIIEGYKECEIIISSQDSTKKLPFFVMEFIVGENLEDWLRKHRNLAPKIAIKWMKILAKQIDYLHKNRIVHRDIKLSNIMLKTNGKPTLIDFGSLKYLKREGNEESITSIRIESIGYTPREQLTTGAVAKSDVFTLGYTFYYLLTGKAPTELTHEQIEWPENCRNNIPGSLLHLIERMTAVSVKDRPNSTELIQEIEEISNKLNFLSWFKNTLIFGLIPLGVTILVVAIKQLLNPTTLSPLSTGSCKSPASNVSVSDMAFSPDGDKLEIVSSDGRLGVVKVTTKQVFCQKIDNGIEGIEAAKFIPWDSTRNSREGETKEFLATANLNGSGKLWNIKSDGNIEVNTDTLIDPNKKDPAVVVALSSSGKRFAIGTSRGNIQVWNTDENEIKAHTYVASFNVNKYKNVDKYIRSISFSQDEKCLAIVGLGTDQDTNQPVWKAQLYNLQTGQLDKKGVDAVGAVFDPDPRNNDLLATIDAKGNPQIRNTTGCKFVKQPMTTAPSKLGKNLPTISFGPDGKHLLWIDQNKKAHLGNLKEDNTIQNIPLTTDEDVVAYTFSAKGTYIATASAKGTVLEWDSNSGKNLSNNNNPLLENIFYHINNFCKQHKKDSDSGILADFINNFCYQSDIVTVAFNPQHEDELVVVKADGNIEIIKWTVPKQ